MSGPASTPPPSRLAADPAKVARIPSYDAAKGAQGQLYRAGGTPLTGLYSTADQLMDARPGLKPAWLTRTVASHVEGVAAAMMRRDGIRDAVLYINAPPCGKPNRKRPEGNHQGCHLNLRAVLPEHYTLTVYTVNANGMIDRDSYKGTGEGLVSDDHGI